MHRQHDEQRVVADPVGQIDRRPCRTELLLFDEHDKRVPEFRTAVDALFSLFLPIIVGSPSLCPRRADPKGQAYAAATE